MRTFLWAAIPALLLPGCMGSHLRYDDVVTTFYPLEYLTERIVDHHLKVGVLIPPDAEPHEYELKPSDLARIQHAKLAIYHGTNLEVFGPRLVRTALDKGVPVRAASEGLATITGTDPGEVGADPHLWLDPVLAAGEAATIEGGLEQVDPANATAYRASLDLLKTDLAGLDGAYAAGLSHCQNPNIITTHAAFGYLARRYHFTQHPISGFEPDAEPSAAKVHEVADLARRLNITTIFFETLVSPRVAQVIAAEAGGATAVLDPIEGVTPQKAAAGADYRSIMRDNLGALRKAMVCA